MTPEFAASAVIAAVALPSLCVVALAAMSWFGIAPREGWIWRLTGGVFSVTVLACVLASVSMARADAPPQLRIRLGTWFQSSDYAFVMTLFADKLSLPFATFSSTLILAIAAFSRRYLHREHGFLRFYFLLCVFGAGTLWVVLAGGLDVAFLGWELVGLSSALLIGFFHERKAPVQHGFRAFMTYRFCDIGLLTALVWMHHSTGGSRVLPGDGQLFGAYAVPTSTADTTIIGLLLLFAAMGKSAQVPFSGWLPRAMEGPTPSSAIFYGALSVHLGPYLLLRSSALIASSPLTSAAVVGVGLVTALHATFVGRTQSDIKSALAYASMTQVGLIVAEIGLGLTALALIHIIGHAVVRSLQILRAPSLLHDYQHLERATGATLPKTGMHLERLVPRALQPWLYRHALERGYLDAWLSDHVVGNAARALRRIDAWEKTWTTWLGGTLPRKET